ncbi:HIT family protein [Verrucomicrobiota bacterium]
MMQEDCIFCRIVGGELPCIKVYEDEDIVAFLDIAPVAKGHTLVIPKAHHNPITHTPDEVLHKLVSVVRKIAGAQIEGMNADGVNVTQANGNAAGQIVPHVHFHVIPRFRADGQGSNWTHGRYDSPEEMETQAKQIKNALGGTAGNG